MPSKYPSGSLCILANPHENAKKDEILQLNSLFPCLFILSSLIVPHRFIISPSPSS